MPVCRKLVVMTLIVSIQNGKGGVGKTTTAIHLAQALSANYGVEVWDADPQGSASEWAAVCAEDGTPLPFDVLPANVATLAKRMSAADVVVIDTPPSNPTLLNAASTRADVVIVPTAPTPLDMARVWPTLDALGDKPVIVLLTHTNPRTVAYRAAREALDGEGVAYFDAAIKGSEALKAQGNTFPRKLFQYGDVARELMELTKEGN